MMSCSSLSAGQAREYFEHTTDYYTKNMTNLDRWHGTYAKSQGLEGPLVKDVFDRVTQGISEKGRSRVGVDLTFSAPKSVSLALAKDDATRRDMIVAHQKAVARMLETFEREGVMTRSHGEAVQSGNMAAAEFLHTLARPTKENGYIPDLDLHSHAVILNATYANGKETAVDYAKLKRDFIKEYGLMYRQELAKNLQEAGYKLEVTDAEKGFFELAGFDRQTVLAYSNRRRQIEQIAAEHEMTDMQKANQYSRETKATGKADFTTVCQSIQKDLFESGRITIQKEEPQNEQERSAESIRKVERGNRERGREADSISSRAFKNADFDSRDRAELVERFSTKIKRDSMYGLPPLAVDVNPRQRDLLLSQPTLSDLAKLQSENVRNFYLRKAREAGRRRMNAEREKRIRDISQTAIKKLSAEKFAFTPLEARQRIMAAGVLEGITRDEAKTLMQEAGLVALGRMERDPKNRYLTTEENIEKEQQIIERVKDGKDTIKAKVLTIDESRKALARAEARENASFSITSGSGEQAEALHHILTSTDRYIGVQGLAGTGKTTLMERLKWVADEQHIDVKGICFTGKAADGLQNESGIESTTVHSFLNKLERGDMNREAQAQGYARGRVRTLVSKAQADMINRKNVHQHERQGIKQEWDFSHVNHVAPGKREIWIVDEAGLVDNNLMNQLQRAAEARGAQVVLSGDIDQLPPVGAGAPMKAMIERGEMGTAYLSDIRRQKDNADLLTAVRESVRGDHLKTFEQLAKTGDYKQIKTPQARRAYIEKQMTEGVPLADYKENLLLASTNRARKQYNEEIRAEYVRRGELDEGHSYEVTTPDGPERRNFADGDRIVFTANDKKTGVMNGTMAVLQSIDERGNAKAVTDAGQEVAWSMNEYNSVDYAYCVTNYKAQGMSVGRTETDENGLKHFKGRVVCDMSTSGAAQNRNALYVDISRAKTRATVVTDDKAKLERQTRAFAKKISSDDFRDRITELGRRGVEHNDRYKAHVENPAARMEKELASIKRRLSQPAPRLAVIKEAEARAEARAKAAETAQQARTPTRRQYRDGDGEGPAAPGAAVRRKDGISMSRTPQAAAVPAPAKGHDTGRGFSR